MQSRGARLGLAAGFVTMAVAGVAVAGISAGSDPEGAANGLVYRSDSSNFAGSNAVAAACPDGRKVTGGGAAFDGQVDNARLTSIAPDFASPDISFKQGFAAAGEVDGLGQTLKAFAICAKPAGIVYRKKREEFTTGGTAVELKAKCPAGTHVVGGGVDGEDTDDALLISAPFDGPDEGAKPEDGWEGRLIPDQTAKQVTVRAVCSDSLKVGYLSEAVSGMGNLSDAVTCDQDEAVSGGGAELTGDLGAHFHRSQPADIGDTDTTPEDGWSVAAHVPTTRTLTVHAICAR